VLGAAAVVTAESEETAEHPAASSNKPRSSRRTTRMKVAMVPGQGDRLRVTNS
jgi:hypothetical protein